MINCAYFSFTTTGDNRICISIPNIMSIYFNRPNQSMEILYNNASTNNAMFRFTEQKYFDDAYNTWNDISYTIGRAEANKAFEHIPLQVYDQASFDLPF